ncbi:HD-GYP domain-containing protein [Sulfurospirillum arsenophilum]|uniref:HD-GYP domain-containing protein n=1 Tax=Sulfurospirillum arsenophilum TaxID=56698 RepID=UPI0005A79F7B|nr:HD domain-containing phosphohydrolase [Sulfurospirillum arsenophilum]
MNIRTKVKLSFVVIIAMLLFLGFISAIITYQIKENSNFRESISAILLMQEGMNDIILESTKTTEAKKLEQLHTEFMTYEKRFESLREMLSSHKKVYFSNTVILNIGEDKTIKTYLYALYSNEHSLELMYDALFKLELEKLGYVSVFNALYPQENSTRVKIQEHILANNRIDQIKALSDLRYYSKEMLYQHGDEATLHKWLVPIDKLIDTTQNEVRDLREDLLQYKEVVRAIAEKAMKIEETKLVETTTIDKASEVLDDNKKVSIALEETISELSSGFIDQMRFIQISVGFVTIIFIIFLALKVSRNVSLTMDEVEAKIEEGLQEVNTLNREIEDTQKEVLFTMGSIGETRSKETGNHVKRVAEYTKILALYYGLDEEEAEMLKLASPMHDIGKIGIPDSVLNKPGRFDEEERKIMDTHAMLGYEMLKHSQRQLLKMAAIVAKEHHERYDGKGYPDKKSGEDIHIYGRITALADVFDALGSARVYKPAWDDEKIFALFREERGKQFDPKLVDIFFEHLDIFLQVREALKD